MSNASNFPVATLLPQGTQLCPVCGDAFPMHCPTGVLPCGRCSTRVELVSSTHVENAAATMARRVADANRDFRQQGGAVSGQQQTAAAAAAATTVKEKKRQDTRQTEDALCDKCAKVRKCYTHALQIRGADEGQTIFYECSTCQYQWSLNS